MGEIMDTLMHFILHFDEVLQQWVTDYEMWTYLILFAIIFCETGLVVTPFLPGDSLLFATGTLCAMPDQPLNIFFIIPMLFSAAFLGDNTNYFIGRFLGLKVYEKDYKLIKKEYLIKTHNFYEKHGGKTLVIARFMPIIRTFAPFVAGVGTMKYLRFISFSVIGNFLWVVLFSLAGYFFGNLKVVRDNFSLVIIMIIFISLLPMIIAFIKNRYSRSREKNEA